MPAADAAGGGRMMDPRMESTGKCATSTLRTSIIDPPADAGPHRTLDVSAAS